MRLILPIFMLLTASARCADVTARSWTFDSNIEASSSLHSVQDPAHIASLELELMPRFTMAPSFLFKPLLVIDQELTQEKITFIKKSDLGFSYSGMDLNPFFHFSASSTVIIPISRGKWSQDSLLTGLKIAPRLSFGFEKTKFLKPFSGFYELSGGRLFHEFTTSTTGLSNNRYLLAQKINLDIALNETLKISSIYSAVTGWTYLGNPTSKFEWASELDYQISSQWGSSAGVSNSGDTLRPNGQDSNVSLWNSNSTQIYVGINYVY